MVKNNCIDCMYSELTESSMMINDLMEVNSNIVYAKCNHLNSPFYDEIVNGEQTCRLFLDTSKYFLRKDRKDKLDEINKNGRKL